jgi:hypothetical protein
MLRLTSGAEMSYAFLPTGSYPGTKRLLIEIQVDFFINTKSVGIQLEV